MKVTIDPDNKHTQVCGKYRYNTELDLGTLYVVSKRKLYPDVVSRDRPEKDIKEAIQNYNDELNAEIAKIRAKIRANTN